MASIQDTPTPLVSVSEQLASIAKTVEFDSLRYAQALSDLGVPESAISALRVDLCADWLGQRRNHRVMGRCSLSDIIALRARNDGNGSPGAIELSLSLGALRRASYDEIGSLADLALPDRPNRALAHSARHILDMTTQPPEVIQEYLWDREEKQHALGAATL